MSSAARLQREVNSLAHAIVIEASVTFELIQFDWTKFDAHSKSIDTLIRCFWDRYLDLVIASLNSTEGKGTDVNEYEFKTSAKSFNA